jgi:hypothetical protein
MSIVVFWVVTSGGLVGRHQCFGEKKLKMEAVCSSEMVVPTYNSAQRYCPEDYHRHKNIKLFSSEDGSSMFLRNTGIFLQVHTALQPRRPTSTYSTLKLTGYFFYF